jgi:hypothetical protein
LALIFLAAISYVGLQVAKKIGNAMEDTNEIVGASGAERMYHTRMGFKLLADNPFAIITGIGPGRYGDYCEAYGLFPSSVTMQVTPLEWIVEYGAIGSAVIVIWLVHIGKGASRTFGTIGIYAVVSLVIAVMFQASWKWEGWFIALAFLDARGVSGNCHYRSESLP